MGRSDSGDAGQNGLTLGVCMIVKNCEDHLEKTVKSLPGDIVSQLVIVDTGSTDSTPEIAKRLATDFLLYEDPDPIEIDGREFLSDFAAARNYAYSFMTTDYIMWIDSDDVVSSPQALRKYYYDVIATGVYDSFYMDYDYEHDEDGNCTMRHSRERITRRGVHVWKSPIHEVLCANQAFSVAQVPTDECRIIHDEYGTQDRVEKSKRNAKVAAKFIDSQGGKVEPRMWLNYGNSLACIGANAEAIEAYSNYLAGSEWVDEKYMVCLSIAGCYRELGALEKAVSFCFGALDHNQALREAYIELANIYKLKGDFNKAIHWAEIANQREKTNISYKGNPVFLETRADDILCQCYIQTKQFDKAAEAVERVLKVVPGHRKVLAVKALIKNQERENEYIDAYKKLEGILVKEGDSDKIDSLRGAIPRMLEDAPEVNAPVNIQRDPSKPSICIYTGEIPRTWGYDSIEKGGIGGSETAVIRMSEELAKIGWHVEVYGFPDFNQEGLHNGVWWLPHWRVPGSKPFDVFVNWRTPWMPAKWPEYKAGYVWLHDVQYENQWNELALQKYNKIIVLSEAHRKNVEFIPDDKIWISRNGLDPSFFEPHKLENDPHRLIYASCPSRGLVMLLHFWDDIRAMFPEAQLDVFYGFNDNFKESMKRSEFFRSVYENVMRDINKPGVNWHGMVDQNTLGDAFSRAGIWAYPTNFPEISCITAMQAQATGSIPVCTGYWALSETVKHGVVSGGPFDSIDTDNDLQSRWFDSVTSLMKNPALQEDIRKDMVPWARKELLWSQVAKEWDSQFRADLGLRTRSPDLQAVHS